MAVDVPPADSPKSAYQLVALDVAGRDRRYALAPKRRRLPVLGPGIWQGELTASSRSAQNRVGTSVSRGEEECLLL